MRIKWNNHDKKFSIQVQGHQEKFFYYDYFNFYSHTENNFFANFEVETRRQKKKKEWK